VPFVRAEGLTEAQKKAYVIADNQLALNAGWDYDKLKLEVENLEELNFDIDLVGFDDLSFLEGGIDNTEILSDSQYTKKINSPTYEPTGEKPNLSDLCDHERYFDLIGSIERSNLPKDEQEFLKLAASRHIVFNFENIAEYYSHMNPEGQKLFEDSALIIIDFNKAIEDGYVELSEKMVERFNEQ